MSDPPLQAPTQDSSLADHKLQERLDAQPDSLAAVLGLASIQRAEGRHIDALALIERDCGLHLDHLGARISRHTL